MAGKRGASSDLNHENWDKEDEPEDAGTFQRAPENNLKNRIIKTARRRNPISSVRDNEEKKSAFSGFVAFSQPNVTPSNAFSFLSNFNSKPVSNEQTTKLNGFPEKSVTITNNSKSETNNNVSVKNNDYYSKLKGLNESVSKWIARHVESNPFINLQPVFKDYENYFKSLEKEKTGTIETNPPPTKKVDDMTSMSNFVFKAAENIPDSTTEKTQQEADKTTSVTTPLFTFGTLPKDNKATSKLSSTSITTANANTSSTFSFGSTSAKSGTFSFGSNASTISNFTFSSSTPLSFGNVKPTSTENQNKEEDDEDGENKEEEEPQLQKVVESDYIYTSRCKVFLKKNDKFNVHGVGNLYLKSVENSDKAQVIVRADNNLGNLLCNFLLSNSIPIKRMGDKDVMLICLPTPDFEPPPVPTIIRVKTTEEADELFKLLEKHKN